MKKKIVLLNCHGDDVACFRKEIIDKLIENKYEVIISCPESNRLKMFKDNNIIIENIIIDRRGTNPFKDLKLLFNYIALFKKYKPDIICTFTIKPNIYGSIAADLLHIPHINNITGLGSGFQNGGIISKIVLLLYKISLSKSQMVFFQNKENEKIAIDNHLLNKNTKYKCIPGSGVNLSHFLYKEKEENKKIVFNYIGRVLKDKRIDDYLNAAEIIKKKYKNVIFNVIGFVEPTEKKYIKKLSDLEKKKVIKYYGSVDDVRPLIWQSDATIHPSSYGEGMSNVLLETAACGRCIITTNVSGCKETVEDGKSGFIYEAENIKELVCKIEKFLSLTEAERKNMGKMGRKRVQLLFNRDIVINSYLEIIKDAGL